MVPLQTVTVPSEEGPRTGLHEEDISNLLADFRESRAFLLSQGGGKDAQMEQKREIRETP